VGFGVEEFGVVFDRGANVLVEAREEMGGLEVKEEAEEGTVDPTTPTDDPTTPTERGREEGAWRRLTWPA